MNYIYGLDGLRAIAVTLVIIQHLIVGYLFHQNGDIGGMGVSIFFVLSGFLITSILIKEKYTINSNLKKIAVFYIRRFLRIFPIYYLTVTVGIISGIYWFSHINPLWYYTYTLNIYIAIQNHFIGYVGHFWSLCVEEQFYLFWPALILFSSKSVMKHIIIITILIGFFTLTFQSILHLQGLPLYVLPFQHLFALGTGALLAYFHEFHYELAKKINTNTAMLYSFSACLLLLLALVFIPNQIDNFIHFILFWILDISVAMLIHNMAVGYLPNLVKTMELYPVKIIGKTSYGIYLYHYLVPELYIKTVFSPVLPASFLNVLVYIVTTGVITALSWILIEKPCNKLKKPFTNWILYSYIQHK